MKILKTDNCKTLSDNIASFFEVQEYKDIIDFSLNDVSLDDDISSPHSRIDLEHYPYMIEPLKQCSIEQGKRKEVVVSFPEQMGKTTIEMLAILYNCVYNTLQCIITYPSSELAVETSTVKFIPLFKKIKQFKDEIEKPFAIRSDRLKLSNAMIYWQGAGNKIVSKSAKLVLGDECAVWNTPNNINNIEELKKRTRSYSECLQLFVSTPSFKETPFWSEFLEGSQGYYHLRCQKCGKLSMRSCDINNLQFESVYNDDLKLYQVKHGSCRLICPECKYEHEEKDRCSMIQQGGYIHKFTDRIEIQPSFQAGVLASMLNVHSWDNIADKQLSSGKTASLEDLISWDNSYRGLPYQERSYNKQDETAISKHYYKQSDLKAEDIEAVYCIADTQDTFSVLGRFALTKDNNFYMIDISRPRYLWLDADERQVINAENKRNGKGPEKTVLDILNEEYKGIKPLMMLTDSRGHRTEEVRNFARMQKNIVLYQGTNLKFDLWKWSENVARTVNADARKLQAELIFLLYVQQNKESGYLYLPDTLTDKDIEEITAFQPNKEKRDGGLYENWDCADRVHDVFDVLKMFLCALKVSVTIFRKERFRIGEARILNPQRPHKQVDDTRKFKRDAVIRRSLFQKF